MTDGDGGVPGPAPAGAIHLNRNRLLYGNLRVLWRNFVPDGTVTVPSLPGFDAENLRHPASSLKWRSPTLSDQAPIRIDLGEPAPPSTTCVLHDVNLSTLGTWRLRGDDSELPADLVALPVAELGRTAGVQGNFPAVTHGVDAATSASISLPPVNAYIISFAVPSAPPSLKDGAGLLRIRLRTAIVSSDVTLRFELGQARLTYVTEERTLGLAALPPGAILQVPFNPAVFPDPDSALELLITHVAGDVGVELEEIDLVYETPAPASGYDSRWLAARDPLPSELARVIDASGGYGTINVSHLLTQERRHRYWEIRFRDGLNPHGFFEARSVLLGLHFGTPELLPLTAEAPRLELLEDVQTLLSGHEVRTSLGRPRRTFPIETQVPILLGLHEVLHGAPTAPCAVLLWPGNGLADQPLTLVGKLTELESELDDASLRADRMRVSLTFREI